MDAVGLTKSGIAERLYKEGTFPKGRANDLVNLLFSLLVDRLSMGESVKILGFGSFFTVDRAPKMGRNPVDGQPLEIKARRVPIFKVSDILKEDIMSRYAHRLGEDGLEEDTLPPREGENRALRVFINNTELG